MTDKQIEFLRTNLYIVAGLLAGLGLGIAISAAIGRTYLKLQVPQFVPGMIAQALFLIASILIGYLRKGPSVSAGPEKLTGQSDLTQSNI